MNAFLMRHPALGTVEVRYRANAVRFTARRRADRYVLTAPDGASGADILAVLDRMLPRLRQMPAPAAPRYADGYTFRAPGWAATVTTDAAVRPGRAVMQRTDGADEVQFRIAVAPGTDFDSPDTTKAIAHMLCTAARDYTARDLLPRARALAAELGAKPREWSISGGRQRLGFCTASGRVALSGRTAMLPDELRRYVLTHELAHLTHFDHSPAFHALWRQYLGCDPAPLKSMLRNFNWPA